MKAIGNYRYEPRSQRSGSTGWQPWRVTAFRCLYCLGMVLIGSLFSLLTFDQEVAIRPIPMRAIANPLHLDRPLVLATPLQPEKSKQLRAENVESMCDFIRDGLEFVVAGLEISGKLAPIKQIVATIGQFAQWIAEGNESRLIAEATLSHNESQVLAHSKSSSMSLTTWLLQNSGANR